MLEITRRHFLAAAAAPLPAQQRPVEAAIPRRHLFARQLTEARLASLLVPRAEWKPFPARSDRGPWEALPAELRTALLEDGERRLQGEWPSLPASRFLEYAREGNRSRYEGLRNARRSRLRDLVLAECIEARGRFLDEIVNGIWLTCEETFWGVPAHLDAQRAGVGLPDVTEPYVDLFAAETSAQLAWTWYLLGPALDQVSKMVRPRIEFECRRRVLDPCRTRDDFGWMGLGHNLNRAMNNWTPWICSNWLTTLLLLEEDPRRRAADAAKIAVCLDRFLDSYHDDGGCDEGPGYWGRAGASLFDCLELLYSAGRGAMDFYREPLIRNIGRYVVHAHIYEDWYTNFADASAKVRPSGFLVWRFGRRVGDEDMQALGAWLAARERPRRGAEESLGRALPALFWSAGIETTPARQPLVRDAWMPGIQVMIARLAAGSPKGLYLAAQGGHNAESHNHNDVGNFIVYADGEPLLIDAGVDTYTAQTFSSRRYEIWTMQSAYHNLPTIGGVMQGAGRRFQASKVSYRSGDDGAEMSLSLAQAYPEEAGIREWMRTLRLDRRRNEVLVRDQYLLSKAPAEITLTLMSLREPRPSPGIIDYGLARVFFDARALTPKVEEIKLPEGRLRSVWGPRLWRTLLVAAPAPREADWTVRVSQRE
jgi:hypothetical protein